MTKILIFPFLSISTGHHHVADSLQTELLLKSHHCEKIDIFSHAYQQCEVSVTKCDTSCEVSV